jgi:hypothetical protein
MPSKTAPRELYIGLSGKRRDDGSLFITSTNASYFSAVVADWNDVLVHLKKYLEVNVGTVADLHFLDDPSELIDGDQVDMDVPPAHVVAKVTPERARIR